jgi:hypothetical protein
VGAQPRKQVVTIDFGNERQSEMGDVVCPWGRRAEGDEQKQKLYEESGIKCCVSAPPQKEKNSSKKHGKRKTVVKNREREKQ